MSDKLLVFSQWLLWIAVGVMMAVLGYMITYGIMNVAPQENATRLERTVKAVCDYGNKTIDGEAEEACGIALDTSGLEYNCTIEGVCDVHAPTIPVSTSPRDNAHLQGNDIQIQGAK